MRAIAISPSLNRSGASQSKIYLAPRRFLRLLHEGPHNHDTLYSGSHVQRPRNAAAAFQAHFPETAFNMLDVGCPPSAQAVLLDGPTIRASLARMSSGKPSTSPSTVLSRVS